MKFKNLALLLSVLLLLPGAAFAHDGDDHDEEATVNNAVAHFAAIGTVLAADSIAGVANHAHGILAIMDAHMAEGSDHHDEMKEHHEGMDMDMDAVKMEAMHKSMREALDTLAAKDTKLDVAREAYKSLSADFVPMAQKMYQKSEVDPAWAVMNCPMMKADWIQVDGKVANPFYGSKMLTCGKKVADLANGHAMKGMEHGDHMDHMKKDESKKGEHPHGG